MRLIVKKHSPAYWQVTIDNPPLNLFDPEMGDELTSLVEALENDSDIKVVVFDSANPEYFIAHIDLIRSAEFDLTPRATSLPVWPDVARRFELSPFLTVGLVRGRARGVGSEFIQALDVCFASKEKAKLSQIEVGCGLIPGGGGLERLPRLIGRRRALEVVIGADDFDADTAAAYGWINRAIPDAALDEFVDRFAKRVASFEREAIAAAKKIIYKRTGLAKTEEFLESEAIFFEAISWTGTQKRIGEIMKQGFQQPGEYELELGANLGPK
jgi:enoyl-CoA hydratase/carnithine racemase